MNAAIATLAIVTAVGAGCTGGALYAFSSFVMPALRRLPPAQGLAAMQSINITAVRPAFMLAFAGTAALSVAVAFVGILALDGSYGFWLLGGAVLYLVGVFGLTMGYHVPRNDALATLAPDAPASADAWATYARDWTAANHVRAAAGLLAAAAFAVAATVG